LTNCLLVGVTNWGSEFTFTTNSTVYYATDVSGVFQTVGSSSHYLIAGSTNRDAGTTNLNAELLAALRKKTTYPPVEITTNFTGNTTLLPQAARDTDTPDLGWHSEALDFVVSGRTLTNSTLTLTNGVVLGTYGASGSYGIFIASGGQFISGGSPTDLNRIVRYNTVQEQATTNWSSSSVAPSIKIASSSSVKPQVRCRFTGFSIPGSGGYHFYGGVSGGSAGYVFNFQDCQFAGSGFYVERPGVAITNSLFERVYVDIDDASQEPSHYLYNNLFIGGTLTGYPNDPATWLIKDNFFDRTTISATLDGVTHGYNGYVTNYSRLTPNQSSDVVLTNSPVYQASHLGRFYYPTNDGMLSRLINAGSRNATNAGLYYFTTTTNQARENNTTVDVGFHFAADLDGDGLVDYADTDDDGDGIPDDWEIQNGLNPELNDANDDPDGDWLTNLQEYNGGTSSTNPRDVMVVAWGNNADGQCNVPLNLRDVKAIAAGDDFSLALRNDGSVWGWGANDAGQTNVPTSLTNAAAITANFRHAIGVRSNATITMWGVWWYDLDDYSLFQPADLTNVTLAAAGANHNLARRDNGALAAWSTFSSTPYTTIPTNVLSVKSIAAGYSHSVAALSNGSVVAWGENFGSPMAWNITNVPSSLTNGVAVAAGDYHTVALKSDGTVAAWGAGNSTTGSYWADFEQSIVPTGLSNVLAVSAGGYRSLALRADGTIVGWGDNFFGQGTPPPGVSNLTAIAAALNHTLAIRNGRQLPIIVQHPSNQAAVAGGNVTFTAKGLGLAEVKYQWQFYGTNITGATNATLTLNNVQASNEGSYQVVISTGAGSFTSSAATFTLITPPIIVSQTQPDRHWAPQTPALILTVQASGPFLSYQWKLYGTNLPGQTSSNYTVFPFTASEERQYSCAVSNAAAVTNSITWKVKTLNQGGVAAWGSDSQGQLAWPVNATNVIGVAAGGGHSLAVREDGSVLGWGLNDSGQTNTPSSLTNAIAVAAGNKHGLALRDNGTVMAWGRNTEGQTNVPSGLTNVMAIAACGNQSIALRSNGTVTNWGNTFGTIPSNLTDAIAIAAGTNFSLALRSNGTVLAWGNNGNGQTNVPAGLTNVVAIAAGDFHALALKVDGTVTNWGLNTSGQTNVPSGLSNVLAIAAGRAHSVALKNDGTVVCWGDNSLGQTNIGSGLNGIKLLAAGGNHTLASAFSKLVQYQVDVTKDLLLVYNSTSTNSIWVKDYYLAHRPMVAGANVLGIDCTTNETFLPAEFTNDCAVPVLNWLVQNPTKHPQYLILFLDIPSRVNTNNTPGVYQSVLFAVRDSVSVQLYDSFPGIKPFITHINMNGTNDCRAYIDKLRLFGTNYSPGKLIISASAGGQYNNTNYVVDNVRHVGYAGSGSIVSAAVAGLVEAGVPTNAIAYADQIEPCTQLVTNSEGVEICVNWEPKPHLTTGTNVAGYISWGAHSSLGPTYPTNGLPSWSGHSGWWIIQTIESFNGVRGDPGQGTFLKWFSTDAFGGTDHSNTPVGAVTHVDEPQLPGVTDSSLYFWLWATRKNFAICAWSSRRTERFQAVGDPFVVK
jgi:alpha-tubulin suppressor-like RCC1 family protein